MNGEEVQAFSMEPFADADCGAYLDWIRHGYWFAADRGGGVFEVRKEYAVQITWIQFRVKILGSGRKELERIGERIERDIDFLGRDFHAIGNDDETD